MENLEGKNKQINKDLETIKRKWKNRKANINESPLTNRGFDETLTFIGIQSNNLEGKVLDIGSAEAERFARDAKKYGYDIETFSVNPKMSSKEERDTRKYLIDRRQQAEMFDYNKTLPTPLEPIAALVQNLPFKDETFDTVISCFAMPLWIPPSDFEQSFKEICRVLKPGKKAFLGPIDGRQLDRKISRKVIGLMLDKLKIEHRFVPLTYHDVNIYSDDPNEIFDYAIHITKPEKTVVTQQ